MRQTTRVITAGLVACAIGVAGCGSSGGSASTSGGGSKPKGHVMVAFLPKAVGIPYFDVAAQGAKKAAAELGGQFKQVGSSDTTAPAQVTWINTLAQQGVSAIGLAANDPNALVPALKRAQSRGIKTVTYDSDTAPDGRGVFVNQVSTDAFGQMMVQLAAKEMNDQGQLAILSTTTTATNQNAWIAAMKAELSKPKYKGIQLVKIAYGQDQDQPSYQQTQGLLAAYPNLKGIVALSSVALPAAARVLEAQNKAGKVVLTGGSTPDQMRKYVKDGTVKEFALWNVEDLGYLAYYAAYDLVTGKIKGTPGETFTAGHLGKRTIGSNGEVLLGPPFVFDKSNIDKYHY
jgi:rhamnose transport system substrate-binding protein